MRKRTKTWVALGAIAVALAILLVSGFQSGATYYLEIGKAGEMASSLQNRRIQIAGNVAKGTTTWVPENFALAFALTDGTHSIPVRYKGVKPDNFTDNAQVIAEGKLQADGVFVADKLLMQCPSKYEAKTATTNTKTGSLLETGGGGTP